MYRLEGKEPADTPQIMTQKNEDKGNKKPNQIGIASQQLPCATEIEVVVHINEDCRCDKQGKKPLRNIFDNFFQCFVSLFQEKIILLCANIMM